MGVRVHVVLVVKLAAHAALPSSMPFVKGAAAGQRALQLRREFTALQSFGPLLVFGRAAASDGNRLPQHAGRLLSGLLEQGHLAARSRGEGRGRGRLVSRCNGTARSAASAALPAAACILHNSGGTPARHCHAHSHLQVGRKAAPGAPVGARDPGLGDGHPDEGAHCDLQQAVGTRAAPAAVLGVADGDQLAQVGRVARADGLVVQGDGQAAVGAGLGGQRGAIAPGHIAKGLFALQVGGVGWERWMGNVGGKASDARMQIGLADEKGWRRA